jgi:hypothetical protein
MTSALLPSMARVRLHPPSLEPAVGAILLAFNTFGLSLDAGVIDNLKQDQGG